MVSLRYVDTELSRPRWRTTAVYRISPRLQAGFEYNPTAGEWSLIGNWVLQPETDRLPLISFGTSSDRIGTPPGPHAYYVTFGKSFAKWNLGPYISVNYSEFEKRLNFPFGVNYSLSPEFSLLGMNDGRKSHLLLTYRQEKYSITALWIWMKRPGISISFGW